MKKMKMVIAISLSMVFAVVALQAQIPDIKGGAKVAGVNASLAKLKVKFSHDSKVLPEAESTEQLIRTIASSINKITKSIPAGYSLYVIGHASEPGTDEYNKYLGTMRAKEIRKRLNKAGVANNVLKIKSNGEAENKRAVTFKVLKD